MKHSRQPCFRLPVSGDEVVRIALAAYFRAGADATAPIGDPNPLLWSDPETFIDSLCDLFELRLRCTAARAGHAVNSEPERYALRTDSKPYRDLHISEVDPGLWAEMSEGDSKAMGHGCPAPFQALDAPPVCPPSVDITPNGDRLLFSPEGQELPPPEMHADNRITEEATA